MNFLDIVGQIFFFGMFFAPPLSFLLVHRVQANLISKIILGFFMTLLLAVMFFVIALNIAFRNGLGPDSAY